MNSAAWKRETRTGILWSVTSLAAGRVLTLMATLILARLLVPSEFGVVAAILAFLSLLELGCDLGMKATVVYEQDRVDTERLHTAFTLNLLIAAGLCLGGVAAAPLIAGFFGVSGEVDLFRLAVLSLLLTGLGNIQDAILLRDLAFRRRILPELARNVVRGAVAIALALDGMGAASLVFGMLAGQLAWVVLLWSLTGYRPRLRIDRRIARSMGGYGAGAMALSVIAVVATRADVVVVGSALGPAALGIYTIASRVPELMVRSVSWSFSRVAFPALSKMRELDRTQLAAATTTLLRYQALVTLPIAALLAVLASPIVVVLFSSGWEPAGAVMSALAVAAAFDALAYPLGDALKSIRRQPTLIAINAVNIPLLIAAMIIVASVGLTWVAWAVAVQALVHLAMVTLGTARALSMRPRDLAAAAQPALVAAAGVVIGAGAVRLAWPALAVGPLLAGVLAAAIGGLAATLLLAPGTFGEFVAIARRALRRPTPAPEAAEDVSPATPHLAPTRAGVPS